MRDRIVTKGKTGGNAWRYHWSATSVDSRVLEFVLETSGDYWRLLETIVETIGDYWGLYSILQGNYCFSQIPEDICRHVFKYMHIHIHIYTVDIKL